MMNLKEFANGLRLLRSIDSHEIGDPDWWPEFQRDVYGFMMRNSDGPEGEKIWAAMVIRGAVSLTKGRGAP